jgi:hypothetical protein
MIPLGGGLDLYLVFSRIKPSLHEQSRDEHEAPQNAA